MIHFLVQFELSKHKKTFQKENITKMIENFESNINISRSTILEPAITDRTCRAVEPLQTTSYSTELIITYSSIVAQLRTGKIALANYLHSINGADEPDYNYSQGREIVRHVLLECGRWTELRKTTDARRTSKKILTTPEPGQNKRALLGRIKTVQVAPRGRTNKRHSDSISFIVRC